jgi:preprotein translocase subunit SecE
VTETSTDGPSPRRSGSTPTARRRTGVALFIRQVLAEMRKVVYPTRKELITYTAVVMVFVVVVMSYVSALDIGLGRLVVLVFGGG